MEKLGKPGQYTLFAPTDEAFEKLPRDVLERIMSDKKAAEGMWYIPAVFVSFTMARLALLSVDSIHK